MLAIALHYLNGWAMAAADGARKEEAEWPPHPDRVFMALACAHFESEGGDKEAERASLEWLESLSQPSVAAAHHRERARVTAYVPVNDTSDPFEKKKPGEEHPKPAQVSGALPIGRRRRPRQFPVAIPFEPVVYLIWPSAVPTARHRKAIDDLCHKVTHVGHSASFVAACVVDDPPAPTLVPAASPFGQRLRVPDRGRLAQLAARCDRADAIRWADCAYEVERAKNDVKEAKGKAKKVWLARQHEAEATLVREFPQGPPVTALDPRLFRPEPALTETYGPPSATEVGEAPQSLFDPNLIVLTLEGQSVGLRGVLALTSALRNVCMAACPEQPPPEWLSGHRPDGCPTADPHVAFLPLAFVGDRHADGRVLGLALAVPRELEAAAVARCIGPILMDGAGTPNALPLHDGAGRRLTATLVNAPRPSQKTLWAERWTRPSCHWATVTPIALDRHFDGPDRWQRAAESVATGCERIGLPRPRDVLLDPVSRFAGVSHAREFPPLTRKSDGGRMHHVHATLIFDEPVGGPVVVGAGRFRGYGLFRPWRQGGDDA